MRLAILRKKRKSLGNMLPQTVSCTVLVDMHGTIDNITPLLDWELVSTTAYSAPFNNKTSFSAAG